jgi:hypothetical protein
MEFLDTLWDYLVALATSPFGPWLGGAFVATAAIFFRTARDRVAIDKALGLAGGTEPLHLLDLSHGDAAHAMEHKVLVAPERLWTYDEDYLELFAGKAELRKIGQRTALDLYLKSTLQWDKAFAVSLALFVALFWFAIATADWAPLWLGRLALFCGCMGVLYGVVDLAEDFKLASILHHPRTVDPAEAAAASLLTRIKFVTIVLSIVGALVFATLSVATTLWGELDQLFQWVFQFIFARLKAVRAAGRRQGEVA